MKQLTFASLQVTNLEASKKFYSEVLGFEIEKLTEQAVVFKYDLEKASFAIRTPIEPIDKKELGVGVALWFLISENVDQFREKLLEKGVDTIGPIIETPFGRAFHVKDIDGYKLTFLNSN